MIARSLKTIGMAAMLVAAGGLQTTAQPDVTGRDETPSVVFETLDVYVDTGSRPLAAYQIEIAAASGDVKIVGIEGGEHPVFSEPPYYDPTALRRERVIIAAFSTASEETLPTGDTRVATLHFQRSGNEVPRFESTLVVAAAPGGEEIDARITCKPGQDP